MKVRENKNSNWIDVPMLNVVDNRPATETTLGTIKPGTTLSIDNTGVLNIKDSAVSLEKLSENVKNKLFISGNLTGTTEAPIIFETLLTGFYVFHGFYKVLDTDASNQSVSDTFGNDSVLIQFSNMTTETNNIITLIALGIKTITYTRLIDGTTYTTVETIVGSGGGFPIDLSLSNMYYVSSSIGKSTNDGKTEFSPLDKIDSLLSKDNIVIFLKADDIFKLESTTQELLLNNNITIMTYGGEGQAVIDGSIDATLVWELHSTGIYKANLSGVGFYNFTDLFLKYNTGSLIVNSIHNMNRVSRMINTDITQTIVNISEWYIDFSSGYLFLKSDSVPSSNIKFTRNTNAFHINGHNNITIKNVDIVNFGCNAIVIEGNPTTKSSGILIENCYIHDVGGAFNAVLERYGDGIVLSQNIENINIIDNSIEDIFGTGISTQILLSTNIQQNILCKDNFIKRCWFGISSFDKDLSSTLITVTNIRFCNNIIIDQTDISHGYRTLKKLSDNSDIIQDGALLLTNVDIGSDIEFSDNFFAFIESNRADNGAYNSKNNATPRMVNNIWIVEPTDKLYFSVSYVFSLNDKLLLIKKKPISESDCLKFSYYNTLLNLKINSILDFSKVTSTQDLTTPSIIIPQATTETLGGIKVGDTLFSGEGGIVNVKSKAIDDTKISDSLLNVINSAHEVYVGLDDPTATEALIWIDPSKDTGTGGGGSTGGVSYSSEYTEYINNYSMLLETNFSIDPGCYEFGNRVTMNVIFKQPVELTVVNHYYFSFIASETTTAIKFYVGDISVPIPENMVVGPSTFITGLSYECDYVWGKKLVII